MTGAGAYKTVTQGHVAVYARNARWRRSLARSLSEAGHSYGEAGSPAEMRRLLFGQRFDVMALKVQGEQEAAEIAQALEGVRLPLHTILLGSASALPLALHHRRGGTLRYVPGPLPARELNRLVDVSISSGASEDGASENGEDLQLEEVELEEVELEDVIERAASAVYAQAKRKRHRFQTIISGPEAHAYCNPVKLRQALITLLRLIVSLAPSGARISVEAQTDRQEWLIRVAASGKRPAGRPGQVTDALREETKTLTAVSRALVQQGGMLWVDLSAPAAPAFSMTLPLSPVGARSASA